MPRSEIVFGTWNERKTADYAWSRPILGHPGLYFWALPYAIAMLEILPYAQLPQSVRMELQTAVDQEFGHIPVVQSTQWATPDWATTLRVQQVLATFYHLVERIILLDDRPYRAVGLNNVITLPAFRGRGHSTQVLRTTELFRWRELHAELAVLLCADTLVPFYERLGCQCTRGATFFVQPAGRRQWTVNTMLRSPKAALPQPTEIDLQVYPW